MSIEDGLNPARSPHRARGGYIPIYRGGNRLFPSTVCTNCKKNKCDKCAKRVYSKAFGSVECSCRHPDLARKLREQAAIANLDPNL